MTEDPARQDWFTALMAATTSEERVAALVDRESSTWRNKWASSHDHVLLLRRQLEDARKETAASRAENTRLVAKWAKECERNLMHELECPLSPVNNQRKPRRPWRLVVSRG